MIVVPIKEGENIEKALKKFKRKFEKTGVVKELRNRQAQFTFRNCNRQKISLLCRFIFCTKGNRSFLLFFLNVFIIFVC